MDKIKKFKILQRIFSVLFLLLVFGYVAFLIYFIVKFNIFFLVSWQNLLVFNASVTLPFFLLNFVFSKYRKRLAKEVYGEPSEQDRAEAVALLGEIGVLSSGGDYPGAKKLKQNLPVLKSALEKIEKGEKENADSVKLLFDMQENIRLGGEEKRAENAAFADYIDRACALFRENCAEI